MNAIRREFQLLLLLCTAFSLAACSDAPQPDIDSLVSASWLSENIKEPDLVVLDATVRITMGEDGDLQAVSGRESYAEGHIPGARYADLLVDLSDSDSPYQYAVPEPEAFAAAMERLGVDDDSRVVIYSANNPGWAARVWWMLRWIGFDNAALLDGGLKAWTDAGLSLSTDIVTPTRGSLTVHLRPELIVGRDEVHAAIGDETVNIIDALPEAHFTGEFSLYERPGHIPGASNVSVRSLTNDNDHFKAADELATLFDGDLEGRAITYCGGGIAASANAFVMTRLGYEDVAVYTNSLQEWAADPDNPLETD